MKNGYNWNHAISLAQIQDSLREANVSTLYLAKGTYNGQGADGISGQKAGNAFVLRSGKRMIGGFSHFQNSNTDTSTILTKSTSPTKGEGGGGGGILANGSHITIEK